MAVVHLLGFWEIKGCILLFAKLFHRVLVLISFQVKIKLFFSNFVYLQIVSPLNHLMIFLVCGKN